MNYQQGSYKILCKREIAKGAFDMTILCPAIAAMAVPGQFVHVKAEGFTLRRPISICAIDAEKGTIRIVFEVRGKGTAEIAANAEGGMLDIMAPLGNGFTLLDKSAKAVLVGGGIGTPPMVDLAQHYGANATAIVGFRSAAHCILTADFEQAGAPCILCTDDGSAGLHGLVTVPLRERLAAGNTDIVYACGPTPMLKAVAALAKEFDVRCQLSLEERMGCGVGACLVCACKTVRHGEENYEHVCKNGPVFESSEVVL